MFSNDSRSISSEEFNSVFPFTFITKVQHKITTFQCADSFPTRRKQVRLLQNDSLSRSKTVCENATKFYKKNIYSVYHGVPGGLSLPLENLPSHMLFPPNFLSHKIPPTVPVFVDPTKQWMVEEIILKSGEERHVDKYMVMNTTRNKISTKCCREVS